MDLCREKGIVRLRRGGLELVFGPPPVSKTEKANGVDPLAHKRAHYANLLNRAVSDEELKHLPDGV